MLEATMFMLNPLSPGEVTAIRLSSLVTDLAKTLTNFLFSITRVICSTINP